MKRSISLGSIIVFFTLRKSILSRSLRVLIKASGDVVVTAPRFITVKKVEEFLFAHQDWVLEKVNFAKEQQRKLEEVYTGSSLSANSARARKLATDKARYFAGLYGVTFNRISIKNQSTQWGSCSSKRNLNFNYRLVFLPPELVDYVVVHEICHLIEMNHSERFWRQVARTVPDYKTRKLQLRRMHLPR